MSISKGSTPTTARCRSRARRSAAAATLLTATRRYIKLSGALVGSTTLTSKRASILAGPGTTLTGSADPVLKFQTSEIEVYDLEIICGDDPSARRREE